MNYHIVRTNEKLENIASLYNYTVNEIKDLNRHITSWNNLIPGTRIKLPPIPDSIVEELNDTEPFIEDYYPRIDVTKYESNEYNDYKNINTNKLDNNDIINSNEQIVTNEYIYNKEEEKVEEPKDEIIKKNSSFTSSIKLPKNYGYYYDPYEYYRYMQRKKTNRRPKN